MIVKDVHHLSSEQSSSASCNSAVGMFWMHLNSFLPISALHIATIATSNLNCIKAEQELSIISNNQSNNLHDF